MTDWLSTKTSRRAKDKTEWDTLRSQVDTQWGSLYSIQINKLNHILTHLHSGKLSFNRIFLQNIGLQTTLLQLYLFSTVFKTVTEARWWPRAFKI